MSDEPKCECAGPGFCPRYQIEQNEHTHGLCTGKGTAERPCSLEKSQAYRAKWRTQLAKRATESGGPGIVRRAANAAVAIARSAATGFARTPPEVLAVRRAACDACEFNKHDTCIHPQCGCPLKRGLVTKLAVASERCPMGKW